MEVKRVENDYVVESNIKEGEGKPLLGKSSSFMLVRPKKTVDIRRYNGKNYLDLLLGDEENMDVDFVAPKEKTYNFGEKYDFRTEECEIFPKFDYKVLDKKTISEYETQERELKELLEGNKNFYEEMQSILSNDEKLELENHLKEINDSEFEPKKSLSEKSYCETAITRELLDFDYNPSVYSDEGSEILDCYDFASVGSYEDESVADQDLNAVKQQTKKKSWLWFLNPFGFFFRLKKIKSEKHDMYKAKRDLRGELLARGVDLAGVKSELEHESKDFIELDEEKREMQRKGFQNELLNKSTYFDN